MARWWHISICISACLIFGINAAVLDSKTKRAVGIFNVIKFPNDPCSASDAKNGTCYTEAECQDKGGTASGECAEGYGVCCVFTVRCGQESTENCTYFLASGTETGSCNVRMCSDSHVCQLRLDFSTFNIAQPSKSTAKIEKALVGTIIPTGKEVTSRGQCLDDSFSVTAPGSIAPPVICGNNEGQHMYVDASVACNTLSFHLKGTGKRAWEIKITQLKCDFNNLAPSGCVQYYFGSTMGKFSSFNYLGGVHLARQNQNICFRRERGQCRICYATAMGAKVFDVSSKFADSMGLAGKTGMCCGYGKDGMKTTGYDCVVIPGASKEADKADLKASEFCGRQLASKLGAAGARATVCSMTTPFSVRFLSDSYEFEMEAIKEGPGFEISYMQTACSA